MRKASDEPLRKVTLKLFAADDDFLKSIHGWGYTTVIRSVIRAHVKAIQARHEEPFTPCPGCDGHECITECKYPGALS